MSENPRISRRDFITHALAGGLGLGTFVLAQSAKAGNRFQTGTTVRPQGLRDNKNCPDQNTGGGGCPSLNTGGNCPSLNTSTNRPGRNLNTGPSGTRNLGGCSPVVIGPGPIPGGVGGSVRPGNR